MTHTKLPISKKLILTSLLITIYSQLAHADLPAPYKEICIGLSQTENLTQAQQNFQNICNNIVARPDAEDNTAVAALRHEEVAAQGTAAIESANQHTNNLHKRIATLRQSSQGGGAGDEQNELLDSSRWSFFANGGTNKGKRTQTVDVAGTNGLGDASQDIVQGERALDFDGNELIIGVDYRFPGEKLILGSALGYNQQNNEFQNQNGKTELQGYFVSAYATYLPSDQSYLDGMMTIGNNAIDASRPIPVDDNGTIRATDGLAFTNTDSQQLSISLGGGYEFNSGNITITPYTRLDYTKTDIDGYTETVADNGGASGRDSRGMAITVEDQGIDSLIGSLGIRASYPISTANGVFVPQASAEAIHQFRYDERLIDASLPAANGVQGIVTNPSTETSELDRNYLKLSLGVSAIFAQGRAGFVQLESLLGSDDFEDNSLKMGLRVEF